MLAVLFTFFFLISRGQAVSITASRPGQLSALKRLSQVPTAGAGCEAWEGAWHSCAQQIVMMVTLAGFFSPSSTAQQMLPAWASHRDCLLETELLCRPASGMTPIKTCKAAWNGLPQPMSKLLFVQAQSEVCANLESSSKL